MGLIDFGIAAKAPEDKASFFALVEAYDDLLTGNQSVANLFDKTLRFFVKDLYRALTTISRYMGAKAEKALTKQLGDMAEKSFEEMTGKTVVELEEGKEDLALIETNKMMNEGNKFGLILRIDDTAIMRSAQSFMTLLYSLGLYSKVLPKITDRVISHVKSKYPEITSDVSTVSLNEALETVSAWLERVAEKDPKLFRELSAKIAAKSDIIAEGEKNA